MFLDPLYNNSYFIDFGWKKKITDDDSPAFFLVLRYSRSVQSWLLLHCHFRAFTFPFIAPAITFSLCTINHGLHSSTALSCHCHQLYVCHHLQKFLSTLSSSLSWSTAPSKSLDIPHTTTSLSSSSKDRTSSHTSFTASFGFVIFNTVKQTLFKSLQIYFTLFSTKLRSVHN